MKRLFTLIVICFLLLSKAEADYNYTLSWKNAADHTYDITLQVKPEGPSYTDFQLPIWRPGRYYIQDYPAAVSGFEARDLAGNELEHHKVNPFTWRVPNPENGEILIRYRYYAHYMDAGSSYLDPSQAYFNPVNLFMHIAGDYAQACTLRVPNLPAGWKSATALKPLAGERGTFTAADYHEFADSPTILSPTLKTLHSRIEGVDFFFHFQGTFPDDKATEDAFQSNMDRIIREQWGMMGEMPLESYHFIYQLLPYNMGHAVEHKYSSMFALPDRISKSPEAIARANGISAHEFFHLWNVKRIRPAALWPYDYQKEQYTTLHWFTEGVTEYYTQLTLLRAGLIDRDQFFRVLAANLQSLENNYASGVVSPAESSMDSWLARSEYSPSYHGISYYTQGLRLGLYLDVGIRTASNGKHSLDDVLRKLYAAHFKQNRGYSEADLQKTIEEMAGESFSSFIKNYVQGTRNPDETGFLAQIGLELKREDMPDATWDKVGITRSETNADKHIVLRQVLPGSDAAEAGLEVDMVIELINGKPASEFDAEAFFYSYKAGKTLDLQTRSRDRVQPHQLVWTNRRIPQDLSIVENRRMSKKTRKLLDDWLASKAI